MPVSHGEELLLHQVADEHVLAAPQQAGDDKGADRRHEDHGDAGHDTGQAQGQDHPQKVVHRSAPRSSAASRMALSILMRMV